MQAATSGDAGTSLPREAFAASVRRTEKALEELIRLGVARGEIPQGRDAAAAARLLVVLQQGVAASARAGWSRERLRGAVDEALAQLLGSAAPEPPARG
jgi:hypothetical protein